MLWSTILRKNKFYGILKGKEISNSVSNFFEESKIESFIENWKSDKSDKIFYIKSFFESYDLEWKDGNLFTNPQKSGTCAWFSVFWLIVSKLIKDDENPITTIEKMLDKFYEI